MYPLCLFLVKVIVVIGAEDVSSDRYASIGIPVHIFLKKEPLYSSEI
jgi:hypothetical protein